VHARKRRKKFALTFYCTAWRKAGGPDWKNFRPLGDCFLLGSYKCNPLFGYFFPPWRLRIKKCHKWVGLHFGRFFTNSSGHPGRKLRLCKKANISTMNIFRCLSWFYNAVTFVLIEMVVKDCYTETCLSGSRSSLVKTNWVKLLQN
jgi:hypothetical protein